MTTATDGTDLRVFGAPGKATPLSWPESQQVSPAGIVEVDEPLWRELMTPVRDRWHDRATDADLTPSQNAYADRRARRLERDYASRPESCERVAVPVRCGCPGRRAWRTYTCRQHLVCAVCQVKRAKKLRARIRAGVEAQEGKLRGRLHPVLVTLTVRHTGDIGADRRRLVAGWRRFYKALRRIVGPFPYVGTHELTKGDDNLGHPHAHLIVFWPWFDWKLVARLWKWAMDDAGAQPPDCQRARSVRGAAKYLGKYVSKGVNTDDFSPEMRARALAGTYGSRWLFSSVRFWIPFVPECPCCHQPVVRDTVSLHVSSNIRWEAAQASTTRRGFILDDDIRHYQFTIKEVPEAN